MSDQASNFVSPADILGIMFVIGAPDFFKDKNEALKFALRAYREWNPDWSGEGKFPVEVCLAANEVLIGGQGIADLASLARTSAFVKGFLSYSMYVQGIVLTTKQWEEHGRPKIQACFVTCVRNPAGMGNRILFVKGALKFTR